MQKTFLQLCLLAWCLQPLQAAETKTVRLLTVGNSFSQNATHYLGDLATNAGNRLVHKPIVVGGASLELHAGKMQSFESDPDKTNGYYSSKQSLKQYLLADQWDFVTIQQASIKSHDFSTYQPFAGQLYEYIKRHAPQARVLVHQTWEYRVDDPRFKVASPKAGEPKDQDAMYEQLSAAYNKICEQLGTRRIPVGDAFHFANHDAQWGFHPGAEFDSKKAVQPELPDQTHSLNVGWKWTTKNGQTSLTMDGHHANLAGEYLGACVWYEVLFNDSVVENKFVPKGLDAGYAQFLRATAHRAVENSRAKSSPN